MADSKFEYDMDAQLNDIMDGKSKQPGSTVAGQKPKAAGAGGKVEPWNDVPEPAFINQKELTMRVPVADPDREQMQVVKDDQLLNHFEQDIKGRIYECRK